MLRSREVKTITQVWLCTSSSPPFPREGRGAAPLCFTAGLCPRQPAEDFPAVVATVGLFSRISPDGSF